MERERAQWVAAAAAVAGAAAWVVKWIAIAVQGGSGSPVDLAAFFVGLVLIVTGATSLALRLTRGRSTGATVAACLGAVVVAVLLVPVLQIASEALFGAGTPAGGEGGLVVLALAAGVVGVTGLRSRAGVAAGVR